MRSDSDVADFAQLAAEYCVFLDGWEALSPDAILHGAHSRLPRLYSAALRLPDVTSISDNDGEEDAGDEDSDDLALTPKVRTPGTLSTDEWMRRWRALGQHLGTRKRYREMFDPYDLVESEPVVGDLADDLLDVYRDLRRGAELWERGEREEAAWEWQFHFAVHWGDHATSAIRALYALAYNKGLGPPPLPNDA